ncbi:MAG: Crp/Fnr family transcriptional regulator [Proteobacteria bacterium]|nr:Crp/Fnr family transcriptional regulator [Pseudomonadota bacterium]
MRATHKEKNVTQPVSNRIIAMLPAVERADLLRRCTETELAFGDIVIEPGQKIRYVCFPTTAFISTTAAVDTSGSLEIGLVGFEGMFGNELALGVNTSALRGIVQGSGSALRVSAADFRALVSASPTLHRILLRYSHVVTTQFAQVAVCSAYHVVEARLARWLLLTHDRAQSDTFHVTHELLAEMLGVRRAGVSIAAAALQSRDLISYSRGRVTVTNRKGLEAVSCECYKAATKIYDACL